MNNYSYVYIITMEECIMAEEIKTTDDICETHHIHNDIITATKSTLPRDEVIQRLSDIFKLLSDMTRMKIVLTLLGNELCVCDISSVVGMGQSAISHQLRVLRSASLVKYRKDGKLVYYSIDDDHVFNIVKLALDHMKHTMPGMETKE